MKSEKGQSLVELALTLPILLLLIFGITDFGRIFHVYLTIDHAGREAARVASIGKSDSEITATVLSSASSIDEDKLTISISPTGEKSSGSDVTITLTYPVDFITPFLGQFIDPFTLTDTTVMRVE